MRPKKLFAAGCLSLLAILVLTVAYLSASNSLVREYQVVESEGHRQREYKILGFIPYEKQEEADIHVAADFWQAVKKSGIAVGPEVDRKRTDMMIIRMRREHAPVGYYLRTTIKGDHAKLVAFYGSQIKSASPTAGRTASFSGSAKATGKDVSILLDLRSPGAKPGEDEIDFGLGIPGP